MAMKMKALKEKYLIYVLLLGALFAAVGDPLHISWLVRASVSLIFLCCGFLIVYELAEWRNGACNYTLIGLALSALIAFAVSQPFPSLNLAPVICFLELPILFVSYRESRKQIKWAIYGLFFALSALYIVLSFTPLAYLFKGPDCWTQIEALTLGLANPNQTAMNLVFCFTVLTCAFFDLKNIFLRILLAVDGIAMLWLIWLTDSRAGLLVGGIFFITVLLRLYKYINKILKYCAVFAPLLFVLFSSVIDKMNISFRFLGDSFDTGRHRIFLDAIKSFDGIGKLLFGNYAEYATKNLHNSAVSVLVAFGLFAFLFFLLFFTLRLINLHRRSPKNAAGGSAFLALCMIFVYSSVEAAFFISGSFYAVAIFVLYYLALPQAKEQPQEDCLRVLQINTVYAKGSTGKIAKDLHDMCKARGISCVTAYRYAEGAEIEDTMEVSSWLDCHIHNRLARYTLLQGCFSRIKTGEFLRRVSEYAPDVLHLHNLHGSYIHLPSLFSYLKRKRIPVIWTLHDCWSFTGHCAHFTMAGCDKWKTECGQCPVATKGIDTTGWMYKKKKKWFTGLKNMTLVAPSQWLDGLVKQSFLKDYPTVSVKNGIDLSVFKPTESDFREKYGIPPEKKILLGVAFGWDARKGLDVFVELAHRLDESKYQIVLVGTTDAVDAQLPPCILSIHRTENQAKLAEIYTAADLFVNPTREEMFGLVNVEANACGTPVLTFRTGGSPECIDASSGFVVETNDVDAMEREIVRICTEMPYTSEACVRRAESFDKNVCFADYIKLYESIGRKRSALRETLCEEKQK